jgi:regulator of sigma E protease
MTIVVGILAFILLIFTVVGVHELGHFSAARLFGIRVEEFGFGFPPRIWGRRRGQTLYSINAIPLGGFVRMSGENGEIEGPWSFGAKPAWQRAIVLCAGAFMNIVLALVLFFIVFTIAPVPQPQPQVLQVMPHSPATAVLRVGDVITAVNGYDITWDMLNVNSDTGDWLGCYAGQPTVLTIERDGQTIRRTVVPRLHPPSGQGRVGFRWTATWSRYDGLGALSQTSSQPGDFFGGIGNLISPPAQPICVPQTSVGVTGPVGIAQVTSDTANAVPQLGAGPVLYLAAVISMNLGFVNLIPFPALDGGRLLFVLIGVARRRRIDPRREGLIHLIGMAVLLSFIFVVTGHDIANWLNGK